MAIPPPSSLDFYKGITTEMLMQAPKPSLTLEQMLTDIRQGREAIEKITGISTLAAAQPGPGLASNMTATEIMAKVNAERHQQLHSPRIIESIYCTEPAEDWSEVRSPGRARRRRHKHRQNIRPYQKPTAYILGDMLHVHPVIMRMLRERLDQVHDDMLEATMLGMNYGKRS